MEEVKEEERKREEEKDVFELGEEGMRFRRNWRA